MGADRGDDCPDGDLVTTDRAAAEPEDVLGEPTMLAEAAELWCRASVATP